jgi:hypothetical protein
MRILNLMCASSTGFLEVKIVHFAETFTKTIRYICQFSMLSLEGKTLLLQRC